MLVVTRRTGDEIVIGEEIRVRVAVVSGKHVRLAIDAPPEARIRRTEWSHDLDSLSPAEAFPESGLCDPSPFTAESL